MRITSLVLSGTIFLAAAAPAGVVRGPARAQLQQLILNARHPDLRWPDISDVQGDMSRVYADRDWAPLWYSSDTLTRPARAMLKVLGEAQVRGLNPADYDVEWLQSQANREQPFDSLLAARVELGLSVATARFAMALRFGRVHPEAARVSFNQPADSLDVPITLLTLAKSEEPNRLLHALEPPYLHYWLLVSALDRYRQLARDSGALALPPIPPMLRPGETYAGVPALRRLLELLGDYRDSIPAPFVDYLYTGPVAEAVKRFQMRQGFTPDAVIGDSTRVRLEHPFEQRIHQMEITLERWRWMPRRYSAPPIIVNIPAFRLYAFQSLDLDEQTMLAMNVVVGTAFKTETPVFAGDLEYLSFAPYWDITPTIANKEVKPAALRNPATLTRNHYELIENGEVMPPWPENIARIGQGVRVRQTPGAHNALGRVKFIMPNDYQVYLHDTPSKSLFERTRRDASHGCIRLGDPFALAKFMLRDQPDWTEERIRAAMAGAEPTTVRFLKPTPVVIAYATAVARGNGDVFFYPDIYGHDRLLDRLLQHGYPYPRAASGIVPAPVVSP